MIDVRMGLQRALRVRFGPALRAAIGPLLLGLVLALGLPAASAGANGTPIRIVLSYLNGISNFGPQNATGVAELVTSEGEARVTATGLQRLQNGEQYHVWISNARNERLWLGAFEANEQGVGRLDRVISQGIPDVPEKGWDLMALTVEPGATQPANQGGRISISGRFPAAPGSDGRPGQLPATGGTPVAGASAQSPASWSGLSSDGLVLLALLVVGAVGFGLGRTRPRSDAAVSDVAVAAPASAPAADGRNE